MATTERKRTTAMDVVGGTVLGVAFLVGAPIAVGLMFQPSQEQVYQRYVKEHPQIANLFKHDKDWNECILRSVNGVQAAHPYEYQRLTVQLCEAVDQVTHRRS